MNRRPLKRRLLNRLTPFLLLAVLVAPCAVAAQASQPSNQPLDQAAQSTQAQAAIASNDASDTALAAQDEQHPAKAKDLRASPYCLQHTGSMIRQTGGRHRCTAIGSAYDREDLQRTGATDIGDALRRLDSSIH